MRLLLGGLLIVAACAHSRHWAKALHDDTDLRRDRYECQHENSVVVRKRDIFGFPKRQAETLTDENAVEECLQLRGWVEVDD